MNIRTVSQLQKAESLQNTDLFEISQFSADKYISKKCTLSQMKANIGNELSNNIGDSFNLYVDKTATTKVPLNVKQIYSNVNAISAGNITFYGIKKFKKIPEIDVAASTYINDEGGGDYRIPNILKTKDLIDNRACFVSEDYVVDGDPGTDATPSYANDSDLFMHWHIDDNGTDSTKWINPQTGTYGAENGIQCTHTGFLTIYGWLADKGGVLPQNAWVGLYGNVQVYSGESDAEQNKWVLLQLQPWIRGSNATQLQYVSFNIPVKEGLRLKIKTGFNVNGRVGGFQDSRSVTYALNQPNSFVGYITRAED